MKRTLHGRGRAFKIAVGAIGWAAVWGLAASSGCASIVGADDYKVGDGGAGGGPACGATWTEDNPACEACMERLCCEQLKTCGPGTACAQLFVCGLDNCGTSFELPCLQTFCAAELAASQGSLVALGSCHNNQCCNGQCPATECPPP